MDEVAVAYLVITIKQPCNTLIDPLKQFSKVDNSNRPVERSVVGHHLFELEASAESRIEQGDRAVGGVHGTDEIKIVGYAKGFSRIRQNHLEFVNLAQSLVWFKKRDKFSKNLGDVRPIDLVDDKNKRQIRLFCGLLANGTKDPLAWFKAKT